MSQERQPYANVPRVRNRCNQLDTHEILKREIYKQGYDYDTNFRFGVGGPAITGGSIAASSGSSGSGVGFEDYELYFDSVNRDGGSDLTTGELKWSITDLNNTQDIKNCVQIHIGSFFFPKIYASPNHPEYLYYRRVFMEMTNAPSSQAVFGPNNNKFHFEFHVNNLNGQAVELVPLKDSFFFQRPLTSLTEFNVRFMTPSNSSPNNWRKIQLPPDRVQIQSLISGVGYNPIRFRITGGELTTSVLGPIGSTGSPGIAAFITDYASNDTSTNTSVNDTQGVYITNILNTTDFEIGAIDGTPVTSQYDATLYIPKNRIAFPLRFTSIRYQPTNYIDVVHD